jgi:hypothetical protein
MAAPNLKLNLDDGYPANEFINYATERSIVAGDFS